MKRIILFAAMALVTGVAAFAQPGRAYQMTNPSGNTTVTPDTFSADGVLVTPTISYPYAKVKIYVQALKPASGGGTVSFNCFPEVSMDPAGSKYFIYGTDTLHGTNGDNYHEFLVDLNGDDKVRLNFDLTGAQKSAIKAWYKIILPPLVAQ